MNETFLLEVSITVNERVLTSKNWKLQSPLA